MNLTEGIEGVLPISELPFGRKGEAISNHIKEARVRLNHLAFLFNVNKDQFGPGFKIIALRTGGLGKILGVETLYYSSLEKGDLLGVYQAWVNQYGLALSFEQYSGFDPRAPIENRAFKPEIPPFEVLVKHFQENPGSAPLQREIYFNDFSLQNREVKDEDLPALAEWTLAKEMVGSSLSQAQMDRLVAEGRLPREVALQGRTKLLTTRGETKIFDHCLSALARVKTLQNSQDRKELLETYVNLADLQGGFHFSVFGGRR